MVEETASERAVEDIFAQSPSILTETLGFLSDRPRLVERQQSLPTGRADLIYLTGGDVLLIELKVVTATEAHVNQLEGYVDAYENEAEGTEFANNRSLIPVLLAPEIPAKIKTECESHGLKAEEYDIGTVLTEFQESLFANLAQFQVTGLVTSVAGISLLHGYLRYLHESGQPVSISEAAAHYDKLGKGESTSPESRINNFRKTARNLNLVSTTEKGVVLTDRGKRYVEAGEYQEAPWQVTVQQSDVILELLYEEPFTSDLTYSLVALLRSIFELSKNSYPVPRNRIKDWYANRVGKRENWGERTRMDVIRWLGTYLEELGLASIVDQEFYLTPRGFDLLSYFAIDEGKAMLRSRDQRSGHLPIN